MAKGDNASTGEVAVKKTRKKQGDKPLFFIYNIKDAEGNVIPGATLDVIALTRNAVTAMKAVGENAGSKFDSTFKIS
jgi:hypothetical protein